MKDNKKPGAEPGLKRREVLVGLTSAIGLGALGVPLLDMTACTKAVTSSTEKPVSKPEPRMEPTPDIPSHHEPVMEARTCNVTEPNIEGPYYRQNPPWKTQLAGSSEPGVPLTISGVVYNTQCQPLANATVDVWQANQKGSYDNDGQNDPPNNVFVLRGRMRTNAKGEYQYTTIVPGRYLNGATYRPAHIHYKVSGQGYKTITTQLYFAGDPHIKGDAFVRQSLIIQLQGNNQGKKGVFPIVLEKA